MSNIWRKPAVFALYKTKKRIGVPLAEGATRVRALTAVKTTKKCRPAVFSRRCCRHCLLTRRLFSSCNVKVVS